MGSEVGLDTFEDFWYRMNGFTPTVEPVIIPQNILLRLDNYIEENYMKSGLIKDRDGRKYIENAVLPKLNEVGYTFAWMGWNERKYVEHADLKRDYENKGWSTLMLCVRLMIDSDYEELTAFHISFEFYMDAAKKMRTMVSEMSGETKPDRHGN